MHVLLCGLLCVDGVDKGSLRLFFPKTTTSSVNRLALFADNIFNAKLSLAKLREIDEWGVYDDYL